MWGMVFGVIGIGCTLVLAEALRRYRKVSPEFARKFVHIITGTFIAFWPWIMSFGAIQLLSIGLLAVVFVSKKLHIFKSIHGVERPTYGEILFPIGIFLSATFAESAWIYAAAILHLSLADGFAAVVGVRFIKRHGYKVFGQTKTLIGTATFYLFSLAITLLVVSFDAAEYTDTALAILIWLPIGATAVESGAVYGTDNLFVPLLVISVLNALRTVA